MATSSSKAGNRVKHAGSSVRRLADILSSLRFTNLYMSQVMLLIWLRDKS